MSKTGSYIVFFFLSHRVQYCSLLELHFKLGFKRSGEPYISLKENYTLS